ncbi:MAG: LD-carboxypeptidase [Bacteroidales bacterium]|nr:LD-carboxypeptidase [Bacteroidales bacterium]HOY38171.1 LD-carboxypeptidase [Bacteroidales bacterium]HQP05233.1 LD-carboxypeptidase [Bacteroidales bacterium]
MIIPAPLQKGDTIHIVSPAGKIDPKQFYPAVENLERNGFHIRVGEHVLSQHFQYSGTDAQRLMDVQAAFDDSEAACIICSRGGYGTIRLLPSIRLDGFMKKPKWLLGFSDITILHAHVGNAGVASVHGAMTKSLSVAGTLSTDTALNALKGLGMYYLLPHHEMNRAGKTEAVVTGGNLSVLYSLLGTPYFPETKGKILFIEDLNEYLYHIDRMMISLKLAGVLQHISGLIVGSFSDMLDNKNPFGKNAYQIVAEHVADYSYPVCFGFPAGHTDDNRSIVFGADTVFEVSNTKTELYTKDLNM